MNHSPTDNPKGFTIRNDIELTSFFSEAVLAHVGKALNQELSNLDEIFSLTSKFDLFKYLKNKESRIFDADTASEIYNMLKRSSLSDFFNEFDISDEEALGYRNFYFRLVRENSPSDVGSLHADRWFWDLNNQKISSHLQRTKVWIPLLQDDENPSLLLIPGSHRSVDTFKYSYTEDSSGKRRPIIDLSFDSSVVCPAPIKMGEHIIFHDSLIHGGRSTTKNRVSVEFTVLHPISGH